MNYKKLKFREHVFIIGDTLLVRNNIEGYLIGKLTKILPVNGIKKYSNWPTIEVLWYNYIEHLGIIKK